MCFELKRADACHREDVVLLVRAVGWSHTPEDIAVLLALGRPWRASDPESGATLGVAVWWPMGRAHGRVGLVIVAPEQQGRGIGRALMAQVMEDAGARSLVLCATEEGRPLYQKLGFETVGLTQRHQGTYAASPVPGQDIRSARAGDLADIINLDGAVTGLNRAAMITQMFGAGRVNVLSVAGRLSGYAMARPFGRGHVLGPLVASDDAAAEALFAATAEPGVLRVDRPLEPASLGRFITARDLPGHEITHTMARGAPPRGDGPSRIFSMAGHAWG